MKWLQLSGVVFAATAAALAQPGCPAVNFQTAVPVNSPSGYTQLVLLRQNDGSSTAYEIMKASPFRVIRTTPNFQKQLTACLPGHPSLPPLPPPTGTGNTAGEPSQPQAVARLSSGDYLFVMFSDNTGNVVARFDPEMNLISQTRLPVLVTSPVLVDLNGDGNLDIAGLAITFDAKQLHGAITLEILLGNPDGSFHLASTDQLGGNGFYSANLAVADLNGDHIPDIVVAGQMLFNGGGQLSVFLGKGDGTFQPERVIYSQVNGTLPAVAIADLNGDGKADLAFTKAGDPVNTFFLGVMLGHGDGTFAAPDTYPIASAFTLAIADLNGDGIPDIVTSGIAIFFGDGTGKFPKRQDYLVPDAGGGIILADIDGDGGLDIVEGSGNALVLSADSILFDGGDGTYLGPRVSLGAGSQMLAAADFNHDGFPDLVSLDPTGATVMAGDGDGGFSSTFRYDFPPGSSIASVAVADINNDGKTDFVIEYQLAPDSGTLAVFLGRGDGTFQPPVNTVVPSGVVSLVTGDFNADGKPDVALVTRTGIGSSQDAILILLGNGEGTFSAPVSYPVAASSLLVGDFNNDGKPDLLVMNTLGGGGDPSASIGFLLGKGDGSFTAGTAIAIPNLYSVALGDFNRDGKLDLAAWAASSVLILLGRGDGTFSQAGTYPVFGYPVVADFNGDGLLDVIAGPSYLLGNGDGTFQPPAPLNPAAFGIPGHLAVAADPADVNRDGRIDLVSLTLFGAVSFLNISQPQPAVAIVSAASMAIGPVAPDSWATAFGNGLAQGIFTAPSGQPLPTMLGETTVAVRDSAGTSRLARLLYVSPGQINFLVPPSTATGTAVVTITTQTLAVNIVHTAQIQIAPVAPSLFTLNLAGLAAAYITRVRPGQPQSFEPVFTLQNGDLVGKPIDLGPAGDQVYLILYGTGLRSAGTAGVTAKVEGISAPVGYAGPQNQFAGLDQINVLLPRSLAGTGDASIVVTAAGIDANTVHLTIQ
ncbi:MAG TPA: FG-GAP-like repeat-containing protein [Bryobacteraceae bacterium]|nr:FG-GAP-like repeat-containing protein [Bryobacteraceae bacterium]